MPLQWLIDLLENIQRQEPAVQFSLWLAVIMAIAALYKWGKRRWQRGLEEERRKVDKLEREVASLRARNAELEATEREQRARLEGMERVICGWVHRDALSERACDLRSLSSKPGKRGFSWFLPGPAFGAEKPQGNPFRKSLSAIGGRAVG